MPRRVLVVQEAASPVSQPIWDEIAARGHDVIALPLEGTAQAVRRGLRPDAVILDMAAAEMAGADGRYRAAAGRLVQVPERRLPVLAVGGAEPGMPAGVAEIRASAGPGAATQILRRIAALARLATMQAEQQRRALTAAEFRVTFPDLTTPLVEADADLLVVGASRRYLAVEGLLSRQAIVTGAASPQTALDYLDRRAFDAVVIDMPPADAAAFLTDLRRHPGHFELPAVALAETADPLDALVEAGASDAVPEAEMARSLPRLLRGLVAEHRFRRALRSVYTRGRHLETNDSLTGLYSRGFLMAHLDRARQDMAATGEPFAVCALSVPDLAGINAAHGYAGGDRVLRQVGAMIGRLSRAEDLAARCGCHMVLVMPGTDADAALAPSRRIAGVVRATDLGLPDGGRLRVDLAERLVALDPDEATDDLMRRLLASPSP